MAVRNLLDRNKLSLYILVIIIAFLTYALTRQEPRVSIKPVNEAALTEVEKVTRENRSLRERLARLEPVTPVKIVTADKPSAAIETQPVLNVMAAGTRIPFDTVYHEADWTRPDFEPYWHSNQGHYTSLPDRIHNSYHRLFVSPGTEDLWSETSRQCGISELQEKIKLPVYGDRPEDTVAVVAMQHQIIDVIVLQNQVLLVGSPSRTGLQVLAINKRDLIDSVSGELEARNNSREYLFQTVTPDGYEIDYNTAIINF